MKNLSKVFVVLSFICFFSNMKAQKYYDDQWKKISENYQKGQFKSNLPLILDMQNHAVKEQNTVQLLKSLKAEFSIVNLTEDDTKNDAASKFFNKIQSIGQDLKGEDKLVYQVLLGGFFGDYYSQNSWKINRRTNVINQDMTQIETWSKLDFKNFLGTHFEELSKQDLALQKIDISKYIEIFQDTKNLNYFPTLYDYKSVQWIGYLKNSAFFTKNELSDNQVKISSVYEVLVDKNSGNAKLHFQHLKLVDECGFTKCKNKKEQLTNLYNSSTEGDYKVIIAQNIIAELQAKQKYEEALSWIEKVKKAYPKSGFLNNIMNQENQILQPYIAIKFENYVLPNKPMHFVAEYKNAGQFALNIYEVKEDFSGFLRFIYNNWEPENYNRLKKTFIRKESFDLPITNDYKNHKTSLDLKPLPSGIYVGEYLINGEVQDKFHFIATNSRIIYQNKNDNNSSEDHLLLANRDNGKIYTRELLEFFEFNNGNYYGEKTGESGKDGVLYFPKSVNKDYYRNYLIRQPKTNDFNLISIYEGGNYYRNTVDENEGHAQIFLDREIYRPGQTVYFKVIATAFGAKDKKEKVVPNLKLNIVLNDANHEEVSKFALTTNEFGSVNGSFVLPQGKLNGQFTIEVDNDDDDILFDISGTKYLRVEEYKRPKFEVDFEPIKEEYQYGKTIELKGKAMMYSGVPLSNTVVNYEIKKYNIRWKYFWWYPRENDNENSILGTVKTNEKGEFTINLELKKEEGLDGVQVDNYEINASVTDINGETQFANTNVKVASVSHYLLISEATDDYFTDDNIKVKVEVKNYNEQKINNSYHVKLSKIKNHDRLYRSNFENEIQDLPVLDKATFVQKFPFDYFSTSEKELKVTNIILNVIQRSEESLDLGKLASGKYKLELFNVEGMDTIKTEKVFEVFDKSQLDVQKPFLKVVEGKSEYSRTEKARFYIYTAIPDALLNIYIQNGDGETHFEQKAIKNGMLLYELALPKDEAINQLNIQFQLVAYNDVQTASENVKITSDKKPLRVEIVTFRDKIQPGSKEKWSVKILGEDKEKVTAEVLANMYDKSLDQFAVNSYQWQPLYDRPYWISQYAINEGLSQKYYSKNLNYYNNIGIVVPRFNWLDGGITYQNFSIRGVSSMPVVADALEGKAAGINVSVDSIKTKNIEEVVAVGYGKKKDKSLENIKVRQNLNETAFFYPNL